MLHIADQNFKTSDKQETARPDSVQPSGIWRIETLTSLADIRNRAQEWLVLERECDDPFAVFQCYAWCESWANEFCSRSNSSPEIRIFFIYKGETLAAILPMMINTHMGIRILTLFGEPHSQIATALIKTGVDCLDGLLLCVNQATLLSNADVLAFGPLPESAMMCKALDKTYLSPDPAEVLSLVTWNGTLSSDEYLCGLTKNRRKDFKRKQRKAEDLGEVKFEIHPVGSPKFKPLAQKALSLKREWLERNGMVSIGLAQAGVENFLSGFGDYDGGFEPRIEVLSINSNAAAICIVLEGNSMRHCYLSVYDPDFKDISPGTMLHQYSIHNSIDEGLNCVNFLGYPTHFKRLWANETETLLRYQQAITLRGRIWLKLWNDIIRPTSKRCLTGLRSLTKIPLIGPLIGVMLSRLAPKNNRD